MKSHSWLLLVFLFSSNLLAQQDVALFDDSAVQDVRLTIDPMAWQTLRNAYLFDDYYTADFAWNGTSLKGIGIKSRGSGSRSPHKPNLTLKFNKYVKQKLLGHNTILLKANNQDASMMREYLVMSLLRKLGLPAPREAPARLWINGEFFGLYTIVENPDEDYLNRVFGESAGYLYGYNPIPGYHFGYLGDETAAYGEMFEAKTHEDAPEWAKLYEMLEAVNESNPADFPSLGPAYVDLPGLMRLLAVENYVSDSDGILSEVWGMNNFYLYRSASGKQFRFLPWDADFTMSWAGRPLFQGAEANELTRRALAIPALRQVYVETTLQAATVAGGEGGWMRREADRYYALLGEDARRDPHKQCWRSGIMMSCTAEDFEREVSVVKDFIADRFSTVEPQMEPLMEGMEMRLGAVVNSATHQAGLVPGSLGTIYGFALAHQGESAETWPLPLELGGVQVTVQGVAAPLRFVSPRQINFQVPWNLQEGLADVNVSMQDQSVSLRVPLVHAAPGIFSAVHGSGALVNAADPAEDGETISFYATGLGPVGPGVRDGEAAPLDVVSRTQETVAATLNGSPVEVRFAGLAAGEAGVYRVDVKMPASMSPGDAVLVLTVAGKSSPAFRVPVR